MPKKKVTKRDDAAPDAAPEASLPAAPMPSMSPPPPPPPQPAGVPVAPAAPGLPPSPAMPTEDAPSHKRIIVLVIAALVVLGGAGAGAMFFLGGGNEPPPEEPPVVVTQPPPAAAPAWATLTSPFLTVDQAGAATVHDGKVWVVGGQEADATPLKSVVSFDGATWTTETDFPVSISHSTLLSSNGTLYAFGGVSPALDPETTNAIYASADGTTWRKAGTLPGTRYQSPIAANGDALWSIGGRYIDPASSSTAVSRRVFRSTNGTSWTEVGDNALPNAVDGAAVTSYQNMLWLLGGGALDADKQATPTVNVLASEDGKTWSARPNLPLASANACAVVFRERLWLIGGLSTGGAPVSRAFSTLDGISWDAEPALPAPILSPTCVAYGDALMVIGNGHAFVFGTLPTPDVMPAEGDAMSEGDALSAPAQ